MPIIGPDAKGRYAIRYYDKDGTRKYETFPAGTPRARVKSEYHRRLAERDEAKEQVKRMTVAALADDYLETRGKKLTEKGRARAACIVAAIKEDAIGKEIAAELKTYHFDDWQGRLEESGNSNATVDRKSNVLRAILHNAVRRGKLDHSPLKKGDLKRRTNAVDGKVVWLTPEEWRSIITGVDDDARWNAYLANKRRVGPVRIGAGVTEPRAYGAGLKPDGEAAMRWRERVRAMRPVFEALLVTVGRLSEVRLLRWEQINLKAGSITIHMSKVAKPKVVPMSSGMRADLESRPRGIGKAYVYAKENGEPFSDHELIRGFRVFCQVAGVTTLACGGTPHIHAIRHTGLSWRAQQGASLKELQDLAGHRTLAMTIRYAHLAQSHLKVGVNAIEEMANSGRTQE